MTYEIRPLSFGEILDRSFRVYLDNFLLLFGISAVVLIPAAILLATGGIIGNTAASVLELLFLLVAGPIMHAALIIGVAEAYLGRPVSLAEAYRAVRPIFVPFIGTYLLIILIVLVPAALFGGLLALAGAASRALFVLLLIAGLAIGMYFLVGWSLA